MRRLEIFKIGQGKVVLELLEAPKVVKPSREKIRRDPKRFIQNLAKESNVSYGTMSTVLRMGLKMSQFKHVKKHNFMLKIADKRLQRCKILLSRIQDGAKSRFQ